MFCRKCGSQIPDDSQFCLKCGTKVATIAESPMNSNAIIPPPSPNQDAASHSHTPDEEVITNKRPNGHSIKYIAIAVGVILVFIVVFSIIDNIRKCSFSNCDNMKAANSKYCYEHSCQYSGCEYSKAKQNKYCYFHTQELCCAESDCNNQKQDGSEYCSTHTCKHSGCSELTYNSTDYCKTHQVDMRERLTSSSFNFTLNSAGGIVFNFRATNSTGKEIKYVRFQVDLYNAVGDRVYDEIKDKSYVNVEIIGPVKAGKTVSMSDKIIGYCDDCAKIQINQITIIYADGTSETGAFNYYYKK